MISIDVDKLAEALVEKLELGERATIWMTLEETAEHLRVSSRWVKSRLHEIPHYKVGERRLLFDRREIDEYVKGAR